MWTSAAPASRSICTIWRVVLPRTIESSTTTRRLPRDDLGQRVELHPQAVLAQLLAGLDEGARDVAVLDQAVVLRQAGRPRVAARGGVAGVGHGDHEVGVDRRLAPQDLAHRARARPDGVALEQRVGAREVDVLEDAERAARAPSTTWRVCDARRSPSDTISPGWTSRRKGAPMMSKAHDSRRDAVARRRAGRAPAAAGPRGSRNAVTRSRVMTTVENAPSRRGSTSSIASSIVSAGWVASSAAMISESDVEGKRRPARAARRGARRR